MKTQIKTVTPQWAKLVLETRNPRNRPLSDAFVSRLARDIANGSFITTHQGIAFDENGDLIDGQHRLAAVVLANKSITLPVTTGIQSCQKINGTSLNTFEVIDGGRARGVGQMLQMAGYLNGNKIAAAVKAAILICARQQKNIGVSTAQAHVALSYFGKSVSECVRISSCGKMLRPSSWITGPASILHTVHPQEVETFLREVGDITGKEGSPSRVVARYSKNQNISGGGQQMAFFKIAATALWNNHKNTSVCRLGANEDAMDWLLSVNKPLVSKLASIIAI